MGVLLTTTVTTSVAAVAAALGALSRQPEINKLHQQVRILQLHDAELQATIIRQNELIVRLINELDRVKSQSAILEAEAEARVREALIMQYAAADYVNIVTATLVNEYEPAEREWTFIDIYGKVVKGEELEDGDRKRLASFVMVRHHEEIVNHTQCSVEEDCDVLCDVIAELPPVECPDKVNEGRLALAADD